MTQEEIIENNKIIAEFMGGKCVTHPPSTIPSYGDPARSDYNPSKILKWVKTDKIRVVEFINDLPRFIRIKNLKYHKDWNRLMPVIEKIESLGYFCMINKWTSVYIRSESTRMYIATLEGNDKLKNTYQAVVEFIKYWNNENI